MENINVQKAKELIQNGATVVDVRTADEYNEGHVEGSLNIDVFEPTFTQEIKALDPQKTYVVYCRSGGRSSRAAAMMHDAGFGDVKNLDGGYMAWEAGE